MVSLIILIGVGFSSSLLANIPLVAVMLLMVKGYFVTAGLVPETALAATFVSWPSHLLPVFAAMMFGGTRGGERHPYRRLGQCGSCRHLCLPRQAGILSNFPAVRRSPDCLPGGCFRVVCVEYFLSQSLIIENLLDFLQSKLSADWLNQLSNDFVGQPVRLRIRTLKLQVSTSIGKTFESKVEKNLHKKIIEVASK
jgi:hypothetical protein